MENENVIIVPTEAEAFHLVFTTHNSRTSARMRKYHVVKGPPFLLILEQEIALTKIFGEIILTYLHLLLESKPYFAVSTFESSSSGVLMLFLPLLSLYNRKLF